MALPDARRTPAWVMPPATALLARSKMAPGRLSHSVQSVTKFYRHFSPCFSSQSLSFRVHGLPAPWPGLTQFITAAASGTVK